MPNLHSRWFGRRLSFVLARREVARRADASV